MTMGPKVRGWLSDPGNQIVVCRNEKCSKTMKASELYFACPSQSCPGRDEPKGKSKEWSRTALFIPERFDHSVECPHNPHHRAFVKVCPHCWSRVTVGDDQGETIAIVGASVAGKTCFTAALIRQIERVLSRADMYQMSLEWDDQKGLNHFNNIDRTIFVHKRLPSPTQKQAELKVLQLTVRFPIRGWLRRLRKGKLAVVSLLFPDPAGEGFDTIEDAYTLSFLSRAKSIILLVDPQCCDSFREQQAKRRKLKAGASASANPKATAEVASANAGGGKARDNFTPLNSFLQRMRQETNNPGKLRQDVAVVLAKNDEVERYFPDAPTNSEPFQGGKYDPKIAKRISDRVEAFMLNRLGLGNLLGAVHNGFRRKAFFAASALGETPEETPLEPASKTETNFDAAFEAAWGSEAAVDAAPSGPAPLRLKNPRPKRVEEPLLWLLHQRGLI